MNAERIKEIQGQTAYPNSVSVQQALLKVWNECERQQPTEANNHPDTKQLIIGDVSKQRELLNDFLVKLRRLLNFTHSRPLPKYVEFYLKGIL